MSVSQSVYNSKGVYATQTLGQRPIDNTLNYFVGEMVYQDQVAFTEKNDITNALAVNFSGVSLDQVPTQSIGDRMDDVRGITIAIKGDFLFKTTAAETYHNGTLVGVGADNRTISSAAANKIGAVVLEGPITSLTGAAGVLVKVAIKSVTYPNA